jgi:hypothetical protein
MKFRGLIILSSLSIVSFGTSAADLYKANKGPYEVGGVEIVTLPTDDPQRETNQMELRVAYPEGEGAFPLVIVSHGTFSSKDMYGPVIDHWASHGYIVLLPNHVDSNFGRMPKNNGDMSDMIMSRAADLTHILNSLDDIEAQVDGIAGKIDRDHMLASGHSVGSYVAMLNNGLKIRNPENGRIMAHEEDRFTGVVMMSDPGKMALMPDGVWIHINKPTFLTTGTEDFGTMGDGNAPAPYQNEILTTGEGAEENSKFLVVLDKGDHYFGGLIHRAKGNLEPDYEGLQIFNSLSLAFMDAYTKGDADARSYLMSIDLTADTNGRATLTVE